jgi:hypothetical protein
MLATICHCSVLLYRTVLDATAAAAPVAKASMFLRIDTAFKGRRGSLQSPTRRNSDEKDGPAAALPPAPAAALNDGAAAAELALAAIAEDAAAPAAATGTATAAEAADMQPDAAAAAPEPPEELLEVGAPRADVGGDVAAVQEGLKPAMSPATAAHLCDTATPSPSAAVAAATGLDAHFSGADSSSLRTPVPATAAAAAATAVLDLEPDLVDNAEVEHSEAHEHGTRERADSTSSESDAPPAVPAAATSASLELLTAGSVRRPSRLASLVRRLEAERRQPTALGNTTYWRDVGEGSGSDVSSCDSPGSAEEETVPAAGPNTSRRTAVAAAAADSAAAAVERSRRGLLSPEQVAAVKPAKQGDPGLAAVRTLYDLQDDFESEVGKLCTAREAAERAALPLLRERAILALLAQRPVSEDPEQREALAAADAQYIAADLEYQQEQLAAAQRHLRTVTSADAKQYWSAVKANILAAHSGDELLALPVLEGAHRAALTALQRNTDGYAMYYGELQSYARYSVWLSVPHVKAPSFDVLKRSLFMPEFSNDAGQFIMLAMPPGQLW